jgi:hypothetical protein
MAYDNLRGRRLLVRCLLVGAMLLGTASISVEDYGTTAYDTHDFAIMLHGIHYDDAPAMAVESNVELPIAPRSTAIAIEQLVANASASRSIARDHVTMLRHVQARS